MQGETERRFDAEPTVAAVAASLKASAAQVRAAVALLDAGNTLPFVARYRKEATGGLDESALRAVEDAVAKARELDARKGTVLKTIEGAGLLTPELRRQIEACADKQSLEELYLPYKPKRRTRATVARDRGLGPLAELLLRQETLGRRPGDVLRPFVAPDREVPNEAAAVQGACDIVAEVWSEDAATRRWLTGLARDRGEVVSQLKRGKREEASKFEAYFDHHESVRRVPSHRFLAMRRGEAEGFLRVGLRLDDGFVMGPLRGRLIRNPRFEFHAELLATVQDCYERLLLPAVESAVFEELKEKSDAEAIEVFAKNVRELLLSPPAGPHVTIGIDPGFRTGCKVAVVDGTGKILAHEAIYPTPPRNDAAGAARALGRLIEAHDARFVAIGNGTASRETAAFVDGVLKSLDRPVTRAMVSESGASIYSASELAAREYPDLDVTVRGAVSIAHRLQDPLAELVKLDPKSIGVGQYQHDVDQAALRKRLEREVESCVNAVGVDANTASASLLSYVAGIGPKLAERIVGHRDANGRFESRARLLDVPKLGRKAFEQAAGFLRISDGGQPLDGSAVHPESYPVVERMAASLGVPAAKLVGSSDLAGRLRPADFVDGAVGLPTVVDILAELAKPGRDPRKEFRTATFAEGLNEIGDLEPGMVLEGVVTNVTKFGAFVDVGVHQDGLVHVSQLAAGFVRDPAEVVAVGDLVRVKVLEVDVERKRIGLSRKDVS